MMQNNSILCERQRTAPIMTICKRNVQSSDRFDSRKPTPFLLPIIEGKSVKSVKSRTSHVTKTKQFLATVAPLGSNSSAAQKHRETIAIEPLPLVTGRKSNPQKPKNNPIASKIVKSKKQTTGKRSASLKALLKATCKIIPKIEMNSTKNCNASAVATAKKPSMPSLFLSNTQITVKHRNSSLRVRSKSIVSTDYSTDEDMDYDEPSTFFQRPCPCACGRHNGDDFVGCNGKRCERKWFHISCMGLRHDDVNSLRGWMCPKCC